MEAKLNDERIPAKFWARISVTDTGCWEWTGPRYPIGYSRIAMNNTRVLGHRYFYEKFVGPIPNGMVIDHTCHNADRACDKKSECPHRRCVNPAHLEAVTQSENVLRSSQTFGNKNAAKDHCLRGHPFDAVNTRVYQIKTTPGVGRSCRKCAAIHAAEKAALDREAHLQKGRDYYAANRERVLAAKREYDATHREERNAAQRLRRRTKQ